MQEIIAPLVEAGVGYLGQKALEYGGRAIGGLIDEGGQRLSEVDANLNNRAEQFGRNVANNLSGMLPGASQYARDGVGGVEYGMDEEGNEAPSDGYHLYGYMIS